MDKNTIERLTQLLGPPRIVTLTVDLGMTREQARRANKIEKELSKPLSKFGGKSLRELFTTDQIPMDSPQAQKYMRLIMELDSLTGEMNY